MTAKEISQKAFKIVSKVLNVTSIDVSFNTDCIENKESMCITVFFDKENEQSNFCEVVYDFEKAYSAELLLKKLEEKMLEFKENRARDISF